MDNRWMQWADLHSEHRDSMLGRFTDGRSKGGS
jgi:hypothetical protein